MLHLFNCKRVIILRIYSVKIAFLSPFYPYRGGIAQFSDSLYLALAKNNEVEAFTFTRQYPGFLFPGKTQFADKGDIDRHISVRRVLDSISPFSYYKTAKEILKSKPDVVLISYWMPFFAPAFGKIAKILRKKGIKTIAILHNVIAHEKRFGDKELTKYFFKNCDGFVLLNIASEKDLLGLKPDAKYIIHPHPLYDHYGDKVDKTLAREKLNLPEDKKVILFFGFIRDYKGLDILIESMKYLGDDFLLLVGGEVYGDFKKYDELIDKLGVRNMINLQIRYIPEYEIHLFFSASDVCVLPYRSATQSGIAGIAYFFDLPVIVTNVGGLAEMVESGKTGFIAERPTPEEISSAISKVFSNDVIKSMGISITEYKRRHSWDSLAGSIMRLIR